MVAVVVSRPCYKSIKKNMFPAACKVEFQCSFFSLIDPSGDPGKKNSSSVHFRLCTSFCLSAKRELKLDFDFPPSVKPFNRSYSQLADVVRFYKKCVPGTYHSTTALLFGVEC